MRGSSEVIHEIAVELTCSLKVPKEKAKIPQEDLAKTERFLRFAMTVIRGKEKFPWYRDWKYKKNYKERIGLKDIKTGSFREEDKKGYDRGISY